MVTAKRHPTPHGKAEGEPKKKITGTHLAWGTIVAGIIILVGVVYAYYRYINYNTLAEFNGGKVTKDELVKALTLEASKYDPLIWKDEAQAKKIKQELLGNIVKDSILLARAVKEGISTDEKEMAAELDSFKSGYTEEGFREMLKLKGIPYEDWAKTKYNKHLIQKLIKRDVIDKIEIPADDIKRYYNEHRPEFSHPEQVRARQILVNTWDEAQKIADELAKGGNFAAIAKKNSISPERWKGGDLGYFSKGTHPEVFDRVCFNTPIGETSQVVKSDYGYHIFKVIDKRGPITESIEEATPYITTLIRQQKGGAAYDAWAAPIFEAAGIKINNDLLDKIEVSISEED